MLTLENSPPESLCLGDYGKQWGLSRMPLGEGDRGSQQSCQNTLVESRHQTLRCQKYLISNSENTFVVVPKVSVHPPEAQARVNNQSQETQSVLSLWQKRKRESFHFETLSAAHLPRLQKHWQRKQLTDKTTCGKEMSRWLAGGSGVSVRWMLTLFDDKLRKANSTEAIQIYCKKIKKSGDEEYIPEMYNEEQKVTFY